VKQLLDDYAMKTIVREGYSHNNTLNFVKIALSGVSCSLAVLSHFYPLPFPQNVNLLLFCIVSYFILSAILQFIQYAEKDLILVARPNVSTKKELQLRTSLPKYDENYTMKIGYAGTKPNTLTHPTGRWFSSDGTFAEEAFAQDVKELLVAAGKTE